MAAKKPPPSPLARNDWILGFLMEMDRLRKPSTGKFVVALAHQQWAEHPNEDPVKVAQAWVKRAGP